MDTAPATVASSQVTVEPERFAMVAYDAAVIAAMVREIAAAVGVTNPIAVEVDERTPLSKMSASIDDASSDATIRIYFESGALEDTRHLTNFGESRARLSIGRMLLRASDRLSGRFDDAPADLELTNAQNAAWNASCGGRLERLGLGPVKQQYRYDFRNRLGFDDDADTAFDRLWAADDLAWADLPND